LARVSGLASAISVSRFLSLEMCIRILKVEWPTLLPDG
jgi:hypothetical protein